MARTLLLSSPGTSWREWLKDNRGDRHLVCLDPSDPIQSPPGRVTLLHKSKPRYWRFYGALDPNRAPHVLIAALAQMLSQATGDLVIQMFPARASPLMRQMLTLCAQLAKPDEILVPQGAGLDLNGYPVGPEEVVIEASFPDLVQQAQRKAQWLKLLEECTPHEVDLRRVALDGSRLGCGTRISQEDLAKVGMGDAQHGEVIGATLFLVTENEPADHTMSRALDIFHASKGVVVDPSSYKNVLCSFANDDGEDFGIGVLREIDFARRVAHVASTAVAPAPVRILRLGGLRLDAAGRELGELRPWQI